MYNTSYIHLILGLAPELARSTWMRFVKFMVFPITHLAIWGVPESAGKLFVYMLVFHLLYYKHK